MRYAHEMSITLEQARTLDAVARHGTYALAATVLKKGHTSIVYALRTLEEQTGVALLDRTGYRTTLTGAGRRVLERCRKLLEAEAEVESLCRDLRGGYEPSLRIVCDGIFPLEPIVAVVAELLGQRAPTKLEVFAEFLGGVEDTFRRIEADLMISVLTPQGLELAAIDLPPLRAHLVAHRDHPLARGRKRHQLNELAAHVFLTIRGSDPRLRLSTSVLDHQSTVHLNDFISKKAGIMSGVGFGWMPRALVEKELERGTLREIRWEGESTHDFHPRLYHRGEGRLGRMGRLFVKKLVDR